MKLRNLLEVLFWFAVIALAIRYAHWILAGFAGLFLVAGIAVLVGYFYLRRLVKKTQKQFEAMAAEAAEIETAMQTPKQTSDITADGPIIHIHAETVHKEP